MFRKRLIHLIGVVALGLLTITAPAHAQLTGTGQDDSFGSLSCVFGGPAGFAADPGGNGVNGYQQDALFDSSIDPLDLMDTDPGAWTMFAPATCSGFDGASETGPHAGPFTVAATLVASGEFNNLICNTMLLNGQATVTGANLPMTVNMNFGMTVLDGVGRMSVAVDEDAHGNIGNESVSTGEGGGAVAFVPQTGNCATSNVTVFRVDGAFATTIAGEGTDAVSNGKDSNG